MADASRENRKPAGAKAVPQHELDAQLLREKTARLRELRLAHEPASTGVAAAPGAPAASKKKAGKPRQKTASLSDWLAAQNNEGRRS